VEAIVFRRLGAYGVSSCGLKNIDPSGLTLSAHSSGNKREHKPYAEASGYGNKKAPFQERVATKKPPWFFSIIGPRLLNLARLSIFLRNSRVYTFFGLLSIVKP
jgi:hypothetical protein